jgi:hypothetical protein
LDSDNGSEFVNQELLRYCQKERLTFTRARPYRKNDNCYVEQKNYSVVRQTVGYQHFDTAAELIVLHQLYATLRLYTNFFRPTMTLKSKERSPNQKHQALLGAPKIVHCGERLYKGCWKFSSSGLLDCHGTVRIKCFSQPIMSR